MRRGAPPTMELNAICDTHGERLQLRVVDKVQFAILHELDRHCVLVQLGACHERVEGLKQHADLD